MISSLVSFLQNDVKAVLFDMDGTLVDSMWMWRKIDEELFESQGMKMPDNFQKLIEHMSFTETIAFLKDEFHMKPSHEELAQKLQDLAQAKYEKEIKPKEGAVEFVKELKKRGIKTAICSSTRKHLIIKCTQANGIFDYIDVIISSCEVPKGKPAPDIYLEASKRLQVPIENCIVFEDLPAGITAGKSAGIKVCAVADKYSQDKEKEIKEMSDYYIESYNQILEKY